MLSSNLGYYLTWSEWTNKNTLFFIYTKRPIHCDQFSLDVYNMVLILDGNSEMGAHVRSNLCYLISFRHLIRLREYVFIRKGFFLFIRAQYVLSSHLISVPWCPLKIGNNIFLNLRIFFFF